MFQCLLDLYGADYDLLTRELVGKVKTRTWPGTAQDRTDIESLPDDFPRFKASVVGDTLRIEAMRLADATTLSTGASYARLEMPIPDLPETLLSALAGRSLCEVVDHPAVDPDTVITSVGRGTANNGSETMILDLEMAVRPLRPPFGRSIAKALRVPDMDELIGRTHIAAKGAPRIGSGMATDPRQWPDALGNGWRVIGLRHERSQSDGGHVIAVRFPYDRRMGSAIGRAGYGAWFDRDTYSWRVDPTPEAIDGLSEFLRQFADVVIDDDGTLHIKPQD